MEPKDGVRKGYDYCANLRGKRQVVMSPFLRLAAQVKCSILRTFIKQADVGWEH